MYHVINRGNYRSWIFEDDASKSAFEKCLFEACEEYGWILHAYCVMGNHFHLALETPEGNLSAGMRWLQGTFGMRYNRFRKENGHLFQGRFKSILVEDAERLAWLCHYIHLNPVRAGIVGVRTLGRYRHSSYRWLAEGKRGRPSCLEFGVALDACGGLRDGSVGRRKYREYLSWLIEDEPRQKAMLFDRMSRGWAHGSKEFKSALLEDGKREMARRVLEGDADAEAKEIVWASWLSACLKALGKSFEDAESDAKSVSWKVAVCAFMRRELGCKIAWMSERLNMGAGAGVSRCLKRLREGESPGVSKALSVLKSKVKY